MTNRTLNTKASFVQPASNPRGTLSVSATEKYVHIQHINSGAQAWETPVVAQKFLDRGQAILI
jgi:threonyl-tRNA synthetase